MDKVARLQPIEGDHADYKRSHYMFARTQQEVGLADTKWETRIPPLRTNIFGWFVNKLLRFVDP